MEKRRLQKKYTTWTGLMKAILYVEISVFVHVTEDIQKTLTAVRHLLPPQYRNAVSFTTDSLVGHYKNPILLLKTTIKTKTILSALIKTLFQKLENADKETLSREFHRRLDRHKTFFLRLNKQKAYVEKIELGDRDPILIKIKLNFFPNNLTEILNLENPTPLVNEP